MTITMIPLECGAPEAFENPNPDVAERAVCFDPHSGRQLLVAEKKGLHRLQWMRTLRFMSFFSKRFRALGCPNWAALLMGYFESPYSWEIKLG